MDSRIRVIQTLVDDLKTRYEGIEKRMSEIDDEIITIRRGKNGSEESRQVTSLLAERLTRSNELARIENLMRQAEVSSEPPSDSHVGLGSVVKVRRFVEVERQGQLVLEQAGDSFWQMVGYYQTDIRKRQLGQDTPLAGQLMARSVGDEVSNPLRPHDKYVVLEILPDWPNEGEDKASLSTPAAEYVVA